MVDTISRADAVEVVHKYFVEALYNEPHEIDEDGDDVFTDMESVSALLHHNKMISKALKALPSTDRLHGEWIKHEIEDTCRWVECSECHKEYPNIEMNFCPNCGKRMRGGDIT